MIAAAHQPHFLPWLGYLNKVARSDVFIWLDTVQFRKNYFQNRTRIAGVDGVERWLTLPVHAHLDTAINAVEVAEPRWKDRVGKTIQQMYGKAAHFAECWEPLHAELAGASNRLADVNYRLFRVVLDLLGIATARVVVASELSVVETEPTDRLVKLCEAVGASSYIAGKGGRQYMREEAFASAGIDVIWQQFDVARTQYPRGTGTPLVGLSVIDCLFHAGPERARELVDDAWIP
ncbi:MAG TPA: WbqC family protein [Gemmatimonadaceae bacterium]